jgi:hypothetical protein
MKRHARGAVLSRLNSSATTAVPVVWPSRRVVACAPLAPPLRSRGVAPIIARLLGDWKKPKPMPHNAVRHAISRLMAVGEQARPIRPVVSMIRPAPARMLAG